MNDMESLSQYRKGTSVSLNDIKRRLMLLERYTNVSLNDHYYLLQRKVSFGEEHEYKGHSINKPLSDMLDSLSDRYLELRNNELYVKQEQQTDWQDLISMFSPLLLIANYLIGHISLDIDKKSDIQSFYADYIFPNSCCTALVPAYIPELQYEIQKRHGLHDLHIHLNGTVEADQAWINLLLYPDENYTNLQKAYEIDEMVKEQFECEGITPKEFYDLVRIAQRIRSILFSYLFNNQPTDFFSSPLDKALDFTNDDEYSDYKHPFARLVDVDPYNPLGAMTIEALMYSLVIKFMGLFPEKHPVGELFHFYILIKGLSNRFLVQQTNQFGFREFQKITKNSFRHNVEKLYKTRFFQLSGNNMKYLAHIEGRFSPQNTDRENSIYLASITKGWEDFEEHSNPDINRKALQTEQATPFIEEHSKSDATLKLVAHFIKEEDKPSPLSRIRHEKLRYKLNKRACVLAQMIESKQPNVDKIVGIDAASSEFDADPEVFAPIYRYLRRSSINHFTYHAGEDFYHILGGLRAIYEAITFLELSYGDRIGHGVAAGANIKYFLEIMGDKMYIEQGNYMSDLIFAYDLITNKKEPITELTYLTPIIANRIQELSDEIFKEDYTISTHISAWKMRKYCPIHLFTFYENKPIECFNKSTDYQIKHVSDLPIYDKAEANQIKELLDRSSIQTIRLYQMYHSAEYRKEYSKVIEINPQEIFNAEAIELLQLTILKFMHKKEIVLETLPTSNLRIGIYKNYDMYHLWNWERWEDEGNCIPPIVMGTDDTGIFATNIYNEYANVYCYLVHQYKMPHHKAINFLMKMERNAEIYKFT